MFFKTQLADPPPARTEMELQNHEIIRVPNVSYIKSSVSQRVPPGVGDLSFVKPISDDPTRLNQVSFEEGWSQVDNIVVGVW